MKATLNFANRFQAEKFATTWSRYSLRGHVISAGTENVSVTIFNVTEEDKIWIDSYVSELNQLANHQNDEIQLCSNCLTEEVLKDKTYASELCRECFENEAYFMHYG
jgi:hypothetical protein